MWLASLSIRNAQCLGKHISLHAVTCGLQGLFDTRMCLLNWQKSSFSKWRKETKSIHTKGIQRRRIYKILHTQEVVVSWSLQRYEKSSWGVNWLCRAHSSRHRDRSWIPHKPRWCFLFYYENQLLCQVPKITERVIYLQLVVTLIE